MGMTNTCFINATGLNRADMPIYLRPKDNGETLRSAAKDVATLARKHIRDDPDYSEVTSIHF
ncbi:hypothetical protein [Paenibacillus antibioticophila]|uniref:hypothetical protein n=1 Tax=Paenibacillus antibioticophila TaxID=1274374 RepID=UPI000677FFF7|nr:hypothetical protein [Paenibacillus antibioticophila]